ncbi:uncharacterized protein LY89DRAFT_782038 [Mollisia scopiformis]|uniref:Uncharacterized protein n=1 Tax=Mollisia scopiformis TaxID=149040 RepID=A0A194X9B8_MOLSC|nr:uncharacterized protein LY89DRAFT_782038 [Mollisia scopiformis]KUJ16763.1 hypothetical protein LY89DRAFT_782038 [Mollisia scopiformis]
MSSLDDILNDNAAFSVQNAQASQASLAHLTILRMFCAVYEKLGSSPAVATSWTSQDADARIDTFLRIATYRYTLYLDLLVSVTEKAKETWPLPPWDVAIVMHTHLLAPKKFSDDITSNPRYSTLASLIDFPLMRLLDKIRRLDRDKQVRLNVGQWHRKFPHFPYDLITVGSSGPIFPPHLSLSRNYDPSTFSFPASSTSIFSFDLPQAVKRQMVFAQKITSVFPWDPVPEEVLLDSQFRYGRFLNLFRLNTLQQLVPTMNIDLFWHTHQLSASRYLPWCVQHLGQYLNHDDSIDDVELSPSLDETSAAWKAHYNEDYLSPPPQPRSEEAPPPYPQQVDPFLTPATSPNIGGQFSRASLNEAQLNLWTYDVERQREHETYTLKHHRLQAELAAVNRDIANRRAQPIGPSRIVRSVFRVAIDGVTHSESAKAHRLKLVKKMNDEIAWYAELRKKWRHTRWPLLVAARGWGDPNLTSGAYSRPSQGTRDLPFAIYGATWYDNKPLGYHDYPNLARDAENGIVGGGLGADGGMCGGKFDGGNCAAILYRRPAGTSSSGGGCGGGGGGCGGGGGGCGGGG